MLESHLKSGGQDYVPNVIEYGLSITDVCLSLLEILSLLEKLALVVDTEKNKKLVSLYFAITR